MAERKPSKPWRVKARAGGLDTQDFRGQKGAYEYVQTLLGQDWRVTVEHWEDGGWCLYERLEPDGSDTDWAGGKNRPGRL